MRLKPKRATHNLKDVRVQNARKISISYPKKAILSRILFHFLEVKIQNEEKEKIKERELERRIQKINDKKEVLFSGHTFRLTVPFLITSCHEVEIYCNSCSKRDETKEVYLKEREDKREETISPQMKYNIFIMNYN